MSISLPFVIFGPHPDAFYVGYGRRYHIQNMPQSLVGQLQTNKLSQLSTAWVSMHPNGVTWIGKNWRTNDTIWDNTLLPLLVDYLKGQNGKPRSTLVTFCDDGDGWFVKHDRVGGWDVHLGDNYPHKILQLRSHHSGLDSALDGIIFGKDGTHIYCLSTGFVAELNGEANSPAHPLFQVLQEFSQKGEGWTLDPASSLCFYDSRYYSLKFKKGADYAARWNLPPSMSSKLQELRNIAAEREEQIALQQVQKDLSQSAS